MLTMVEATTRWLETYSVPHMTAHITTLGFKKNVICPYGTPDRIESDFGAHFKNILINTGVKDHSTEQVYHTSYHAPASGIVEQHNGLLKS